MAHVDYCLVSWTFLLKQLSVFNAAVQYSPATTGREHVRPGRLLLQGAQRHFLSRHDEQAGGSVMLESHCKQRLQHRPSKHSIDTVRPWNSDGQEGPPLPNLRQPALRGKQVLIRLEASCVSVSLHWFSFQLALYLINLASHADWASLTWRSLRLEPGHFRTDGLNNAAIENTKGCQKHVNLKAWLWPHAAFPWSVLKCWEKKRKSISTSLRDSGFPLAKCIE